MRRLSVFNTVTLDSYFTGIDGDMSWAHSDDAESSDFAAENAKGGGELVFGRITYEQMFQFWPTPAAMQTAPVVAEQMNKLPKVVFSKTLDEAAWNNTRLVRGDPAAEIPRMKKEPGLDMVIFGSGSIVAQLAGAGLIDEYQIMLKPIVLGTGRTMFEGIKENLRLKLTKTRTFNNGNVFLSYEPMV
jgi:dihydrofolate reductase